MLRKLLFTAVVTAAAAASMNASAIGRLADVTVIDRSTGETLPVHFYKGEYWVAGTPGAKYSVAVANGSGGRVMAVMSVDGVNVLNGQTASVDQSGYVFNGYQRYDRQWKSGLSPSILSEMLIKHQNFFQPFDNFVFSLFNFDLLL